MRTLGDYNPFLKALFDSIVEKSSFYSETPLGSILQNPKLLVLVNHSTPLSWIPSVSFLCQQVVQHGGTHRRPRGIADRWFYSNPLTTVLAEYLTQSSKPETFDEIISHFSEAKDTDLVIFPEGANTFFGELSEIQPFRSSKFIEISIRTQAPILLVVHKGSENWSLPLAVPAAWSTHLGAFAPFFAKQIQSGKMLNFPFPVQKIQDFRMSVQIYNPALYESDLSAHPLERKSQLEAEAEQIRAIMQEMLESL
ncbi:MAG: hypothetical protein LW875_00635 [Proteobacteria bacterium]|jgi:hypothetical protein|nr:hypothetical protein [Pseudomonadota bacterium]